MNIFFLETPTGAVAHGVGTYANNLLPEVTKFKNINIYYIKVDFSDKGSVEVSKVADNCSIVKIRFGHSRLSKSEEVLITVVMARAIFCILSGYLIESNENIFHLNSLLQKSIADVAKEYDYKIVFTQHISLWRVFYNNDRKKFDEDWQSNLPEIISSRFIKSINLEKVLCTISDKVICLSEEGYTFSRLYYQIQDTKITLVRNGVALNGLKTVDAIKEVKRLFGYKESDFIFLFVGRLIEQKGLGILINAFRILAEKVPNSKLLIVGGGAELSKFISLASDLCGSVSFTGYIDKQKINMYYDIADVGIMPSVTEQSSFVVLEMLSKKLPTILSDIEAFEEFRGGVHVEKVKTNDNGYVYVDLLCKAMKHLYEDSLHRERIAQSGHQLFLDQYQASTMAEKTYNVYKEVIAKSFV
ncbi:glycosyltransferase family 4 protein [Niabella sp. 22666]|uniref:glycosyltransferase family 4 protein n=1 Tax=Niabella sp. 22666 TaxID=3453954 RepID=UPI003F87AA22